MSRHVTAESKNGVVYFVKESLLEDLYLMTAHVWPFNVLVGLWGWCRFRRGKKGMGA